MCLLRFALRSFNPYGREKSYFVCFSALDLPLTLVPATTRRNDEW
jgi:hypothetical protein